MDAGDDDEHVVLEVPNYVEGESYPNLQTWDVSRDYFLHNYDNYLQVSIC